VSLGLGGGNRHECTVSLGVRRSDQVRDFSAVAQGGRPVMAAV
jgi:hypothetical protein